MDSMLFIQIALNNPAADECSGFMIAKEALAVLSSSCFDTITEGQCHIIWECHTCQTQTVRHLYSQDYKAAEIPAQENKRTSILLQKPTKCCASFSGELAQNIIHFTTFAPWESFTEKPINMA